MKKHAGPIIAAILLLLLPVLYVGSYLALVTPRGTFVENWDGFGGVRSFSYRYGGDRTATIFWPLEQIDRKVRPGAWEKRYGAGSYQVQNPHPQSLWMKFFDRA